MGKKSRERVLPDNEAKAVARSLRVSPQKLDLVASLIRGKPVEQALADLEFSRKRISGDVRKCLMSAVANAENNHQLSIDQLVVAEAYVGKNLVMKRFHARGRGRSSMVMKPFSQITVVVREVDEDELVNVRKRANGGKVRSKTKTAPPAETQPPAAEAKEAE
ncbi:MAG: 50S ribosomal protein L22 [Filomicrobium sp.]